MPDLFRKEALDNQRERLWGDVLLVQPFSFWLLTGAVLLVVLSSCVFLSIGTYARRENVTGFLLPAEGLVKVYATQQGLISKVHVQEGDRVEAGDPLFSVSTGRGSNDASGAQAGGTPTDVDALLLAELLDARRALQRRRDEQDALQALQLSAQRDRLPRLEREIARLERLLVLHEERAQVSAGELERLVELSAENFIADADLVTVRQTNIEAELRLAEARSDLASRRDQLQDARTLLRELPLQASIALAGLDEQLSNADQRILETRGRRAYTILAPSVGRIAALQASPGQRVDAQRPLLTLLPEGARYLAELLVPTRSIGFIEPGQSVLLRYEAFPYQQFGLHAGTVEKVAATILQPDELDVPVRVEEPVYRVSVAPEQQAITAYGRRLDLQAGMLLEASILLENRSLAHWLLAPIYSLRGSL